MVAGAAFKGFRACGLRALSIQYAEGGEVELCVSSKSPKGDAARRISVPMLHTGGFAEECNGHDERTAQAIFPKNQLKKGRTLLKNNSLQMRLDCNRVFVVT